MNHYDVKMIRDFLTHLLEETRVSLFEAHIPKRVPRGEAVKHFMEEYGTCLLPATAMSEPGPSEEILAESKRRDHDELEEYVRCLEHLEPLFKLALKCASHGKVLVRVTTEADLENPNIRWVDR